MAHMKKSRRSTKTKENETMRWDYTLGCIGAAVAIALVLVPPTSPIGTAFWLTVLLVVLVYPTLHLGQWALPIPKHRSRKIAGAILCLGVGAFGFRIWPAPSGRHLTKEQRQGLVQVLNDVPNKCGILVYVPIESGEAQGYGKEIQSALRTQGRNVNLILAGAIEPPTGIVVGVRSVFDPCGRAGEMLSVDMTHTLHMPARLQENFLPYAGETTIVVFVGTKPPYD